MTAVRIAVCALAGLVIGWFLDPVIVRVPRKVPLRGPGDHLLEEPLPPESRNRRIFLAVLTAALFGCMAARFDDTWVLPAYLVLTTALVALSWIDLEHYLLPNRIVYPMTVALVALLALAAQIVSEWSALGRGLIAGAIAFVIYIVLHLVSPR